MLSIVDSGQVLIRRVQPDDRELLGAFFNDLTPQSRRCRFHSGVREVPQSWLDQFRHPDEDRDLALLALASRARTEACVVGARHAVARGACAEWATTANSGPLLVLRTCFASRRLRDPALIEDMVQETPLAALQGGQGFSGKASLRTWLTGILLRRIAEHLRRKKRRPRTVPADDSVLAPTDDDDGAADAWLGARNDVHDPQRLFKGLQSLQAASHCLEALAAVAARLLMLREVDGLRHESASRELGIAPSHASLILHRARAHLRKSIGGAVSHFSCNKRSASLQCQCNPWQRGLRLVKTSDADNMAPSIPTYRRVLTPEGLLGHGRLPPVRLNETAAIALRSGARRATCEPGPSGPYFGGCNRAPPFTPQGVPKRSVTMPNVSAQKVSQSGMVMLPPSARPANTRCASAAVG